MVLLFALMAAPVLVVVGMVWWRVRAAGQFMPNTPRLWRRS